MVFGPHCRIPGFKAVQSFAGFDQRMVFLFQFAPDQVDQELIAFSRRNGAGQPGCHIVGQAQKYLFRRWRC